ARAKMGARRARAVPAGLERERPRPGLEPETRGRLDQGPTAEPTGPRVEAFALLEDLDAEDQRAVALAVGDQPGRVPDAPQRGRRTAEEDRVGTGKVKLDRDLRRHHGGRGLRAADAAAPPPDEGMVRRGAGGRGGIDQGPRIA